MTIIPIVTSAFGTETKGLLKGLEDLEIGSRGIPSKQQHYWKLPEYWEVSWRLEETCCHSISSENHQLTLMWKTLMNNNDNNYKVLRPCWRIEKGKGLENDGDTYHSWCMLFSYQKIGTGSGGFGNERTMGDPSKWQHYWDRTEY